MRIFKKNVGLTLLALPGIALLFIFDYVPLYGLLLPFKDYKYDLGIWNSPWIGLDNFQFLFKGDVLQRVLRNTLTGKGVPLAGEADLKTCAAMLMMVRLEAGGGHSPSCILVISLTILYWSGMMVLIISRSATVSRSFADWICFMAKAGPASA